MPYPWTCSMFIQYRSIPIESNIHKLNIALTVCAHSCARTHRLSFIWKLFQPWAFSISVLKIIFYFSSIARRSYRILNRTDSFLETLFFACSPIKQKTCLQIVTFGLVNSRWISNEHTIFFWNFFSNYFFPRSLIRNHYFFISFLFIFSFY